MKMSKDISPRIILVLMYGVIGVLWIMLSDGILSYFVKDIERLNMYQSYKGWAFVLITTFLLYILLLWYDKIVLSTMQSRANMEAKFNLLFIDAPNPYQSLDINGNLIAVNQKWLELLGYEKQEVIGRWFGDMLAPQSLSHFQKNFINFKTNGTIQNVKFDMLHKNGTTVPILLHGQIVYNDNHMMVQSHCSFENMTDRRNLEHLNQVLKLIRDVNQAIVRVKNQDELLQESCDILMSSDLYNYAWIKLTPIYNNTFYYSSKEEKNMKEFKEKLDVKWIPSCIDLLKKSDSDYIYIKSTKDSCQACPLHEEATIEENGYTLELIHSSTHYGYLAVACSSQFNEEELSLLREVAGDIAYGLYNIETEKILKDREERYRYSVVGARDGIWDWDLVHDTLYFSPRWKEMLGYNDGELENNIETVKRLMHPDDKNVIFPDIKASHEAQIKQYQSIHRLRHKDGHWVWIHDRGQTFFDEHGKAVRMLGSNTDITELKAVENQLRLTNEKFEKAFEYSPNLIIISNLNTGEIYDANQTFKTTFGYKEEELIGKTTFDINLWFDVKDRKRYRDDFVKNGHVDGEIYNYRTKDNEKLTTKVHACLIVINNEEYVLAVAEDITNQLALEVENKKLIEVLDQNVNEVHVFNIDDFHYEYVNKAGLTSLGYSMDEMKNMMPIDILDTVESIDDMKAMLKTLLSDRKKEVFNNAIHIRKDGSSYNVRTVLQVIEFAGTKQIVATVLDMTNFKKIENAFYESQERLALIIDKSPIGICTVDKFGNIVSTNPAYEMMLGYTKEELSKLSMFDITHPNYLPKNKEVFEKLVSQAIPSFEIEKVYICKDGREIDVSLQGIGINDDNNKFGIAFVEDITEKKHTHELLVQKKEELETIIQNAPNPMMLHEEGGKILMINQAWIEISGFSFENIPTMDDWIELIYDDVDTIVLIKEHINSIYEITEKVDEGDFTFYNKNKELITWQFSSAPLGKINGKRTIISTAMDITELKRKDEMLLHQSRHAAMGEMISMIAHQWRQPLSIISMDANNMLLDVELGDLSLSATKVYATNILRQTQHLSSTIDDFRNFFKPDKVISKVDIKEILTQTLLIVQDSLTNHNIELTSTFETQTQVSAYPRELMQVFVNIITNAKDALVSDKIKDAKINIKVYEDNKYINTDISDNAGGIEAKILSKIFDPYFSTKDEKNGTGLGLYMSKMIIEDHLHGIIEVYNDDVGACFRIRLLKQMVSGA